MRFWLANRSYHQSQIGRTISHSWLYHQSWTIDCQISGFWSYNWSYPLTIGRATSRGTSLWLNIHLRTTLADWLHDLRWLMHDPTRSSFIVRSFARPVVRFTAAGRQTNRCMQSKFCISPNIHDRVYVLQIDRNRTNKKSYHPVWLKPNSRPFNWFGPSSLSAFTCICLLFSPFFLLHSFSTDTFHLFCQLLFSHFLPLISLYHHCSCFFLFLWFPSLPELDGPFPQSFTNAFRSPTP